MGDMPLEKIRLVIVAYFYGRRKGGLWEGLVHWLLLIVSRVADCIEGW